MYYPDSVINNAIINGINVRLLIMIKKIKRERASGERAVVFQQLLQLPMGDKSPNSMVKIQLCYSHTLIISTVAPIIPNSRHSLGG